jgi:hypothetical protein
MAEMQKPRVERKTAAASCAGFSALHKLSPNSELEPASDTSKTQLGREKRASRADGSVRSGKGPPTTPGRQRGIGGGRERGGGGHDRGGRSTPSNPGGERAKRATGPTSEGSRKSQRGARA